jgi:hypothetical protein
MVALIGGLTATIMAVIPARLNPGVLVANAPIKIFSTTMIIGAIVETV